MEIISTQCCGLNEIHNLSAYDTRSEEAMLAFCEGQLEHNNKYKKEIASVKNAICTHFFFTAAVQPKEIVDEDKVAKSNYGQAFADFIIKNKLGVVGSTPATVNTAWHPDHSVKAWFWTPDFNNLRHWYVKRRGPRMIKRLQESIVEISANLSRTKSMLATINPSNYLYKHYADSVVQYERNLVEAKKDLALAEKQFEKEE